ncbi:capsid protein [Plant associated genomovirus 17]|uniref:Capsid protein n=1 Tax=Plant associated genomovirus 17 TaxID=2584388 RepID=A0A4Y5QD64_9VIRU|nr:capsid protein [Plant associated genomovirus 17]QCX29472.1 capsid protein [Plant associated genomovirus 17]
MPRFSVRAWERRHKVRSYRPKRSGGPTRRRRYPARRRRYTKRPTMSRKRILNISSRKKRDNMVVYTNTTIAAPQGGVSYAKTAAVLTGNQTYIFPWIATARDLTIGVGTNYPTVANESARTASLCYMRGLKEATNIRTTTGVAWQWRRVCFTLKGQRLYQANGAGQYFLLETSDGIVRVVNNVNGTSLGDSILDLVFDGKAGSDWLNIFNAKLDNQVISVKYDKTRTIASGNQNGIMRTYRDWLPMNKNLMFDDDENAAGEQTQPWSISGRQGMGDYYVMDFFQAAQGAAQTDQLVFSPEATLYWHEK